jgi:hypothetical protein
VLEYVLPIAKVGQGDTGAPNPQNVEKPLLAGREWEAVDAKEKTCKEIDLNEIAQKVARRA